MTDLRDDPIRLNDRHRVTSDDVQWIVQRHTPSAKGGWKNIIFCRTRDGLIANIGYEVPARVGQVDRVALRRLQSLPSHHPSASARAAPAVVMECAA